MKRQPCSLQRGTPLRQLVGRSLLLPGPSFSGRARGPLVLCRSSADDETKPSTSGNATPSSGEQQQKADSRITKTVGLLDSILGVEEDPKKAGAKPSASSAASSAVSTTVNANQEALKKRLAEEEAQRLAPGDPGPIKNSIEDQFTKIIEKARKLADEQARKGTGPAGSGNAEVEQQQLRQEFEALLQTISKVPDVLSKEDLKRLKDAAFGPQTFWLTEAVPIAEADRAGLLVRGNLRDERTKVFNHVCQKVKELFGDKYEVLMVEDAEQDPEGASSSGVQPMGRGAPAGPRVAFQIVPAAQALPPQTNGWKQAAAFVLSLLLIGSCLQLALAANITKLPRETLEYFANPKNFDNDAMPPGLETWDPSSYLATAFPILVAVLGVNLMHEIGHRLAAAVKGVKLGPTYFVPNLQIGSFGAVTPFTSLLRDRTALWDVAAAGPLAGAMMSGTLLVMGLLSSDPDVVPKELLVPVPTPLFQGSLLLGTITRMALGEEALRGAEVLVSPLTIAGWCGLVTTALNVLPAGSLDGGRMVQAAFGRQALALSSFFSYVGLGLGLLGSSLALPFGLYVIICQRSAEKFIKDSVTPAGEGRQTATAVAVLTAILILLPMAPELADSFGVGPSNPFM